MPKPHFSAILVSLLVALLCAAQSRPTFAQGFRVDRPPTPDEQRREDHQLALRNSEACLSGGRPDEAYQELQKAVGLCRRIFGQQGAEVADDLRLLGDCAALLDRFAEARTAYTEARDIAAVRIGAKCWQSQVGEERLLDLATLEKLSADNRQAVREAQKQLRELSQNLDFASESEVGDTNYPTAPLLAAAATIEKCFGKAHRWTMLTHVTHARAYVLAGDLASSLREAHSAWEAAQNLHPHDPEGIHALQALADRLSDAADFARAETIYLDCLRRQTAAGRTKTEAYAATLNNLALVYESIGDVKQAQTFYERAFAVYTEVAKSDEALGLINGQSVVLSDALARIGGGLALGAKVYHEFKVSVLPTGIGDGRRVLLNLAMNAILAGNLDQAKRYLDLETKEKQDAQVPFPLPILEADSLSIRATYNQLKGYLPQAEERAAEALRLNRQYLPPRHPKLRVALNNLANLKLARGKAPAALGLAKECLSVTFANSRLCASVQSARQQMALSDMAARYLGTYLTMASVPGSGVQPEEAYRQVLQWKGAAAWQSLQERPQPGEDAAKRKCRDELNQVRRKLAAQFLRQPRFFDEDGAKFEREEAEKLIAAIDRLEAELRGGPATGGKDTGNDALIELRELFASTAVLIDIVEYPRYTVVDQRTKRYGRALWLAAFVVPPVGEIRWVDLGPSEPLASLVEQWRRSFGIAAAGRPDAAAELRKLVWNKLEPLVADAKHIVISPAGPLAQIPWAALPGKQPGTYLLEERTISYAAAPIVLPYLMSRPTRLPAGGGPTLLAIGDVDFGGDPGSPSDFAMSRAAPRTRESLADLSVLAELPGSCLEALAVQRLFEAQFQQPRATLLRRQQATEQAVRDQVPNALFLHFATHGFFGKAITAVAAGGSLGVATAEARSAAGFHPTLLSGLTLAGAKRPLDPSKDDGILTALEVEAMDVSNVEMAVLSACETGLGKAAAGEGVLGLSRSFHAGGTRTVVASLWQVSDQATRQLMTDFYENLWKEKLPRAQALRQAQLKILREGLRTSDESDTTIEAECANAAANSRGLRRVPEPGATAGQRTSPFYWGAFVLSGSWE